MEAKLLFFIAKPINGEMNIQNLRFASRCFSFLKLSPGTRTVLTLSSLYFFSEIYIVVLYAY